VDIEIVYAKFDSEGKVTTALLQLNNEWGTMDAELVGTAEFESATFNFSKKNTA